MDAQPFPVGAQVIVLFLSDRTASGMVMGEIEGLLSWRRVAAPAFAERMQPHLQATAERCAELDPVLTVVEDAFTADTGLGMFSAAIAMPDGRVFLVPGAAGATQGVVLPHTWDPYTGALHAVPAPWEAGDGTDFMGGCLLLDGRIFFPPSWASLTSQAYIYDPELDRLAPAGEAVVTGYNGCTLLPDGRVLLVPCSATSPLIYDPRADSMTVAAAVTPPELQTGLDFAGAQLLPDGRVLLVPYAASKPLIYDVAADSLAVVDVDLGGGNCGGAVLLGDGRVLITLSSGSGMTVIFDPATDTCSVTTPPSHPGGYHAGGALLADGRVLVVPGINGDLVDCRVWDPVTDTYAMVAELAALAAVGQGAYLGGCVLVDGRVVFAPYYGRNLVMWEPGLGAAYGRDIALAAFWNHRP